MSEHSKMPHSSGGYHPWSTYIAAREEARRRGDRRVSTEHVLAEILELQAPDLAADLLATLGVQPAAVRERLADV